MSENVKPYTPEEARTAADWHSDRKLAATLRVYADMKEAMREIAQMDTRRYVMPPDWTEQVAACSECKRYDGHPIQQGICDAHRQPLWARERHDRVDEPISLGARMREIARRFTTEGDE